MKKVILFLILLVSLNAETLDEYKISVVKDMSEFHSVVKVFDKTNSIEKQLIILSDYLLKTNRFDRADFIVLIYLNYKQNIYNEIAKEYYKDRGKKGGWKVWYLYKYQTFL